MAEKDSKNGKSGVKKKKWWSLKKKLGNWFLKSSTSESMSLKRKQVRVSREEREEVCEFIKKQLRKGYIRLLIRPSKLSQIVSVFFVGKKNDKKIWYKTISI